jgi:hypothetical protein
MFRLVLEEYLALGRLLGNVAIQAEAALATNPDRRRLILATRPNTGRRGRLKSARLRDAGLGVSKAWAASVLIHGGI